jgi:hypothetical protein
VRLSAVVTTINEVGELHPISGDPALVPAAIQVDVPFIPTQ